MKTPYCVVYVTAPRGAPSKKITQAILKARVAACVNATPVESTYWWEGKLCDDRETLLVIKTKQSLFAKLSEVVRSVHPYKSPEIIALPIIKGRKAYLEWIHAETK